MARRDSRRAIVIQGGAYSRLALFEAARCSAPGCPGDLTSREIGRHFGVLRVGPIFLYDCSYFLPAIDVIQSRCPENLHESAAFWSYSTRMRLPHARDACILVAFFAKRVN